MTRISEKIQLKIRGSSVFGFRVAAFAAGKSVLVLGHENACTAFRAFFFQVDEFVAFNFVVIFNCHQNHSSAASSAAAGAAFFFMMCSASISFMRASSS